MLFDSLRQTLAETEASMDQYHAIGVPVPDELLHRWESLASDLADVVYCPISFNSISPEVDDTFIQQWLARTAAVPLSLGFYGHMTEKWSEQVKALLTRHAPRTRTLALAFFIEDGFEWLAEPREFPSSAALLSDAASEIKRGCLRSMWFLAYGT
ncbi:hypothetical protein B0H12DRAFT_1243519 [Mycena haematopus]|nr:hypothetical protein B0H12DRAFT_1243519 [Mycena haematopus]